MSLKTRATCVFCCVKDETEVTGALSTKDDVTAHQNCLLYSSGIICQSSPEYDDLFGFSVEDVKKEVTRGSKLKCSKCKSKGATAGCENRRCKKSYHYPCAIKDGAHPIDDEVEGKFSLYCCRHWQQQTGENDSTLDENPSTSTAHCSNNPSEPGPSKPFCLTCLSIEGLIQVKSMSDKLSGLYCGRHAPPSLKRSASGNSTSDSNSSTSGKSAKKRLSYDNGSGEPLAKRTPKRRSSKLLSISDSDDDESSKDMEVFAPLESEGELQEDGDDGNHPESPVAAPRENQAQTTCRDESNDETETELQSLLQGTEGGCARAEPHVMTSQASVQTESPGYIVELKKEVELVLIDNAGSSQPSQSPPPAELLAQNQGPPPFSDPPRSDAGSPPAPPMVSPAPSALSPSHPAAPLTSSHATPVSSPARHLVCPPAVSPSLPTAVSTVPSAPSAAPPVPSTIPFAPPPAVNPTLLTLPSASPAARPAPPTSFLASSRAVSLRVSPPASPAAPSATSPPSSPDVSPAPHTPPCDAPGSTTLPPDPEPSVDAAEFWRNCNAAGCTQSIFSHFISEMSSISSRIISEEASQEDYDVALHVMKASGKLKVLLRKEEKELERKQMELQKVAASMQKIFSLLRR